MMAAKKKPVRRATKATGRPKTPESKFAPAQRLLVVRKLLASAHGATLEDIEERLACSRHTAMRAVSRLEEMGDAVHEEREGRRLRYRIVDGKVDKPLKLGTAHVLAVAAAREAMSFLEGTGLKEAFDEVVALIESRLAPKEFTELAALAGKVVLIEDAPWAKVDRTDVINGLVTGLARGQRVTLKGAGSDGERTFDFDPYTLVFWRNGIYVAGYSHHHKQVRLFGLDQLTDGDWKKGETFKVPETWDARAAYGGSFDPFEGPETTVKVEFAPKVARYVVRRDWTQKQHVEEHEGGRVVVTAVSRGTIGARNWVLGWGENAVVLEPASLRNEMAAITAKMASAYARTT